jgi:integrase
VDLAGPHTRRPRGCATAALAGPERRASIRSTRSSPIRKSDAESGLKRGKEHRRQFEKEIVPRLGHRAIGSLTPYDLLRLDRDLRDRGLSEATVANYLKPLRGLCEFAALKYNLPNPFLQVPRGRLSSCNVTRKHREWTTAEVLRLIDEGYRLDARNATRADYGLAIEFKLRTGARLGEALGARYDDIDFEQGVWRISGQWTRDGARVQHAKTRKGLRRVPLLPQLVKKLAARKLSKGASDDAYNLRLRLVGNPPSHTNFRRRAWNKAVANAGLTDGPKVTPHDARHAFASEMADLGLDSADVAEVMGHTTAGVTERIYTHAFNREAREQRIREAMMSSGGAS